MEKIMATTIRGDLMGEKCKSCRMSYGTCTDRIFKGRKACCDFCYETDAHDEQTVMNHENTLEALWALHVTREGVDAHDGVARTAFEAGFNAAKTLAENKQDEEA